VQHDRESRNALFDLGEDVQTDLRIVARLELERAVAGADRDRQRIDAGALEEVFDLFRLGVGVLLGLDVVFDAGQDAEFAFDGHVELVGVFNHFTGLGDILLIRQVGAVDHDRRKSHIDAALAGLEVRAVVEVQTDRNALAAGNFLGVFHRALREVAQQRLVRVFAGALGNLKNHRGLGLDAGLNDGLELFHIVEVVRRDRVFALHRLGEHLFGVHEAEILVADRHKKTPSFCEILPKRLFGTPFENIK